MLFDSTGARRRTEGDLYQEINPVKQATKRWYANFSNGALHRLEDPEVQIEGEFDVMIVPGETIIAADHRAFEGLFKTADAVTARIHEWILGSMSSLGEVTIDYEVHKELATSNSFRRRKWQSVHKFTQTFAVTPELLRNAMEEAEVDCDVFFDNGRLNITEDNVDEFLGLMNEDYFKGSMSGRKLRAQRKSPR